MSLQPVMERKRPPELPFDPEAVLLRASALFGAAQSRDLRSLVAAKAEDLQHYDVSNMDRVVAILMWGRSGSLLLSSYLDGHEDVIMLPEDGSQMLYEFFERYQSFPLRDKLIAYAGVRTNYPRFFDGDFAISPDHYYAAVQAILEVYGNWPPEFLESRRAFFLFVHIAYNLALGRRTASSRPVIVYAQHVWDNVLARDLVEDFPQAKFIHTIRDPISSYDGVFHYHLNFIEHHILLPYVALSLLADKDGPQCGMESRTKAIRFEDLHCNLAGTMHDLCDWLGLRYQPTLLNSTFNGIPWVVKRDGVSWTGPRLEQVQRRSWNVSSKDRALLYAVFYENFVAWNYPCPRIFRYRTVRCMVALALFLAPMKTEFIGGRAILKRKILPSLQHGNIWPAIKALRGIGLVRLKVMQLITGDVLRRCAFGTTLLQVGPERVPAEERVASDASGYSTSDTGASRGIL